MSILNYFKPVSTWSPEKVRQFLKDKNPGEFNLVDVRTPKEYERGHLAGAELVPMGELANRLTELDSSKPTIVY
jgi:rhodanese-related sulfurtransferase